MGFSALVIRLLDGQVVGRMLISKLFFVVDGGWTTWTEVGDCTVTCGTGEQGFSRSCTNPIPAHNGANCVGGTGKSESCERDPCPGLR